MTQINDCKLSVLETALATTGHINDLYLEWCQANGATSPNLNQARLETYQANGAVSNNLNDAENEFYVAIGATGSNLTDNKFWFFCTNSGAVDTTLFHDTFTDTDGVALDAHTPDIDTVGGGWVLSDANAFKIISNSAGGYIADGRAYADVSNADVAITSTIRLESAASRDWVGTLFRYVDSINYWVSLIDILSANDHRIWEITSGAWMLRSGSSTQTWVESTDYASLITINGTSITSLIDGETLTYTSASHQTATEHGIMSGSQLAGNERVKEFRIESL